MDDFIRRSIERKRERNSRINGAMIRRFIKIKVTFMKDDFIKKKRGIREKCNKITFVSALALQRS